MNETMKILLTNDDGVFSPGIAAMAQALSNLGDVLIAAPATEQSGVGQGITFLNPLTLKEVFVDDSFWGYAVEGTPVDCVKLGTLELSDVKPDLVVSGINNGLNAGANIIYSGTVAAALEGAYSGITSVAVSVQYLADANPEIFRRTADVALALIRQILKWERGKGELFNVNVPRRALDDLEAGGDFSQIVRVAPMDDRPFWNEYDRRNDPSGRRYYWLSGRPFYKEMQNLENPSTDVELVSQGFITLTPLGFNPTKFEKLREMRDWSFDDLDAENEVERSESQKPDAISSLMNFRATRLTDKF